MFRCFPDQRCPSGTFPLAIRSAACHSDLERQQLKQTDTHNGGVGDMCRDSRQETVFGGDNVIHGSLPRLVGRGVVGCSPG